MSESTGGRRVPDARRRRLRPAAGTRTAGRVAAGLAVLLAAGVAAAQMGPPPGTGGPDPFEEKPVDRTPQFESVVDGPLILDVKVVGNKQMSSDKVLSYVKTRKDRAFDAEQVQADIRAMYRSGRFKTVRPLVQQAEGGVVVIFEVAEQPLAKYVKFVGNRWHTDNTLAKQISIKEGEPIDPFRLTEDLHALEDYHRRKGYPEAVVELLEGDKPGDRGVVFSITEGPVHKIWDVDFEGNTIATDARLLTQVESKPAYFGLLFGILDREKVDTDIEKLTAYYRSLGFFRARVSVEVLARPENYYSELVFVVDEGPRYLVRDVSFVGQTKYTPAQFLTLTGLKAGDYFSQDKMEKDRTLLLDLYGSEGHIFADVQAQPRFLEEPGTLDLVYSIKEGEQYRVGQINIHIAGDVPHTRRNVAANRIELQPGDVIDSRKIRDSERRLGASQVFVNTPGQSVPRLTVTPPDLDGVIRRRIPVRVVGQPWGAAPEPILEDGSDEILRTPQANEPDTTSAAAATPVARPAGPSLPAGGRPGASFGTGGPR